MSVITGSISVASFATVIGAPVGIACASFSFTLWIFTRILGKLITTTENKKEKHNRTVILARSKLNTIDSKTSEALINSEISNEDFMTIINEEKNYRELKGSIRMMKTQRSDTEKTYLIEIVKK